MQYIQTNADEYVLHLSSGLVHVTNQSFNFRKILRCIKEGCSEEDIIKLLVPPELTDGCYYAYEYVEQATMSYVHIDDTGQATTKQLRRTDEQPLDTTLDASKLVGVYASLEELIEDWPEYTL